jgi:hypothetical protein
LRSPTLILLIIIVASNRVLCFVIMHGLCPELPHEESKLSDLTSNVYFMCCNTFPVYALFQNCLPSEILVLGIAFLF